MDFIREQRQQRRTWQEIATRLRTDHGCNISFQGLHQFYRRHLKRQAHSHWESETDRSAAIRCEAAGAHPSAGAGGNTGSPVHFGNRVLKHPPQLPHKIMNITRRIHLNPQSKGNLGKSFEAEFRTAWLDQLGIAWNGSDLDDRHHTFANRHPEAVRSYQLGNEHESKTALLSLFRRVLKDTAPVHVIDTRARPTH